MGHRFCPYPSQLLGGWIATASRFGDTSKMNANELSIAAASSEGTSMKIDTSELSIAYLRIEDLKRNPRNSRTHSKRQIRQIAESIRTFGFTNPVLLNRDSTIVAGHGRVAAAKLLGMSEVPTIRLENLSPDEIRAFVIADNRLAERAGWDRSILAIELQHLLTIDTDFDVTVTGFEIPETDMLLAEPVEKPDPDDEVELSGEENPITKPGDLWELGRHRLLCGNSTEPQSFSELLGKKRANVIFTDPPYNLAIDGNVSGKGSVRHREFEMASGEMSEFEFVTFLTSSLRLLARHSTAVRFILFVWTGAILANCSAPAAKSMNPY